MRIAVISDFHFGMCTGTEREDDPYEALSEALDKCGECDLIIFGGDIFDSRTPSNDTFARAMELIGRPLLLQSGTELLQGIGKETSSVSKIALMGTPMVAIHGNHERRARGLLNPVQALERAGFLTYLHCNGVVFGKGDERVAVHGMSGVPDQYAEGVLSNWKPEPQHGCLNVFLMHQSITDFMYAPRTLDLEKIPKGFDMYINGHIHEAQVSDYDGRPFLITGSLVPTQMKEESEKPKGFWIFDTPDEESELKITPSHTQDKNGFRIYWIELENQRRMYYREYSDPGADAIEKDLKEIAGGKHDKKPLVRVKFRGEAKDTLMSDLKMKFGEKMLLSFRTDRQGKGPLPSKSMEEHRLSVEEMGRRILLENLGKAGLDQKRFENIFGLLSGGEDEKAMKEIIDACSVTGKEADKAKKGKGGKQGRKPVKKTGKGPGKKIRKGNPRQTKLF